MCRFEEKETFGFCGLLNLRVPRTDPPLVHKHDALGQPRTMAIIVSSAHQSGIVGQEL